MPRRVAFGVALLVFHKKKKITAQWNTFHDVGSCFVDELPLNSRMYQALHRLRF